MPAPSGANGWTLGAEIRIRAKQGNNLGSNLTEILQSIMVKCTITTVGTEIYRTLLWLGDGGYLDLSSATTEIDGAGNITAVNIPIINKTTGALLTYIYDVGLYSEMTSEPTGIKLTEFDLNNIDTMREDILASIKNTSPFIINSETYAPYGSQLGTRKIQYGTSTREVGASHGTMQGLGVKTYQSDIFNNWINKEWVDGDNGISSISAVKIENDAEGNPMLNLDALNLAQKVYNLLNRIALAGGSYYDWIEGAYGQEGYRVAETPMYQGGMSREIIFDEVISNSATDREPLGSLAGRGQQSKEKKGGNIIVSAANEPSYVMGIVSITPRIDYSQGNNWDVNLKTMDDFHKPEFDGIGYQDLITEQMAAWDVVWSDDAGAVYKAAGKTVAWINYMTNYNKTYGLFADNRSEMFMTLNRQYEVDAVSKTIADLTTYIDPSKYNYAFAQTDLSAQNFWVNIGVRIKGRRKLSAKQIPNL